MRTASRQTNDRAPFSPSAFFSALLKQLYLDQTYVPRSILVPVDFPDRAVLAELLAERTGHRIELAVPQRGDKRSLVDLVCQNAKQSYDQRFRVLQPNQKAIQEALQDALTLEEPPKRIECFDISHIQGAETVASMVVWEDGGMKKSDYRKFQVKTVTGVDDFASMREIIHRRYKRLMDEKKPFPSLILIDGGLGQLHAAYAALEEIGVTLQPLASIAKKEEIIYVYGQENEPVVLDRRSPGAAPDAADPRREPPLRRHLPPQAPPDARPRHRARRHPRRRPAHPPAPGRTLRQRPRHPPGHPRRAHRRRQRRHRRQDPQTLRRRAYPGTGIPARPALLIATATRPAAHLAEPTVSEPHLRNVISTEAADSIMRPPRSGETPVFAFVPLAGNSESVLRDRCAPSAADPEMATGIAGCPESSRPIPSRNRSNCFASEKRFWEEKPLRSEFLTSTSKVAGGPGW